MSPGKVLAFICACLFLLAAAAWFFPEEGVDIGPVHLRYPSLEDVLSTEQPLQEEEVVAVTDAPDSLSFVKDSLMTLSMDSLYCFRNFFDTSSIRIEFPHDSPAVWDSMFEYMESSPSARVLHYGDSQIEQDRITSSVRTFFQSHFSGSGYGAIPVIQSIPQPYFFQETEGDWEEFSVYGLPQMRAGHRRYGPLGRVAVVSDSAVLSIDPRNVKSPMGSFTRLNVLVGQCSPDFSVTVDFGGSSSRQAVTDTAKQFSCLTWQLSTPQNHFEMHFRGTAEVYAVMMDGKKGISVDNIPMRGCSGAVFTGIDRDLLHEAYRQMNVRMIILEYGGNSMPGITSEQEVDKYANSIGRQIRYLHSVCPKAPILFIGPADMACTVDGQITTYPLLETMIGKLKEVCLDNDAAFWDMYRAMGGRNTIVKWASSMPPYAAPDYVHFTYRGARRMGEKLSHSLSVAYDYYRFRQTHDLQDSVAWKEN